MNIFAEIVFMTRSWPMNLENRLPTVPSAEWPAHCFLHSASAQLRHCNMWSGRNLSGWDGSDTWVILKHKVCWSFPPWPVPFVCTSALICSGRRTMFHKSYLKTVLQCLQNRFAIWASYLFSAWQHSRFQFSWRIFKAETSQVYCCKSRMRDHACNEARTMRVPQQHTTRPRRHTCSSSSSSSSSRSSSSRLDIKLSLSNVSGRNLLSLREGFIVRLDMNRSF